MCVYDKFAHDTSPEYGEVCTVSRVYYNHEMPDGIGAYEFEEHPQPSPYRFGAWRRGVKMGSLEPNFIQVETEEAEESETDVLELADEFIG